MHGLSFVEAVQELADRAKIVIPAQFIGGSESGNPEQEKKRAAEREKLATAYRLNRFAAAFFKQNLEQGRLPQGREYLKSRGVTAECEHSFYVGGALPGWDSLSQKLVSSKAPLDLAVQLGLIRPSTKVQAGGGPGYFDLFRNRLVFPILDQRGKVAGFGGRALPGASHESEASVKLDKEAPKYLNSPDSFLFHKSKLAFGLYQAAKHIREKDEVILVEGYFDVIALHRAGFQNVVAACGTALTVEHLAIFRRLAQKVTLLFDGDRAGIQATERAMVTALEQGVVAYGAYLPGGADPDELVMRGPEGVESLKALLNQAKPLLDTEIEKAIKEAALGPEQRVQAVRRVAGWLWPFKDPVGREIRIEAVCKGMGISRSLFEQALRDGKGLTRQQASAVSLKDESSKSAVYQSTPPIPQAFSPTASKGPSPRAPSRPVSPTRRAKLTAHERALIASSVRSDGILNEIFSEFRDKFTPEMTFSDLFEYPGAREWALKGSPSAGLEGADSTFLPNFLALAAALHDAAQDAQVRSIISEALVSPQPIFSLGQVRRAFHERLSRVWARFSQRLKTALADAEAKNDMGLHAQLMKDYLDVQKKMKELNHFYDKA